MVRPLTFNNFVPLPFNVAAHLTSPALDMTVSSCCVLPNPPYIPYPAIYASVCCVLKSVFGKILGMSVWVHRRQVSWKTALFYGGQGVGLAHVYLAWLSVFVWDTHKSICVGGWGIAGSVGVRGRFVSVGLASACLFGGVSLFESVSVWGCNSA